MTSYFGLILNGTWHNGTLTGNDVEKVSNMQKTNQRARNETRKEQLKSYADMKIYATDPARLVLTIMTICHLQLL